MPEASQPFDLSGRDVWVIGGAGHLGRPVVTQIAALGGRVLCADLGERAAAFVAENSLADAVTAAALDVRNPAEVDAFLTAQIAARGVPHGLVVMTYASTARRLEELSEAEFDAVNHGNLTAPFLLARAVGGRMAARGSGSIVLFSSMYGSVSPDPRIYEAPMNPNPIEYGIGKAGMQQMARYLAVHWGWRGVRVNCISPGPFPNPDILRDHAAFVLRLAEKSPLGRVGDAGEIAGAVSFLLGDAASYITGQNLAVDGGWTAW